MTLRVFVTGGSGFVGSNVVKVFGERHGAEIAAPTHATLDLTDAGSVRDGVASFGPDAIVHCAILNDLQRLYADRRAGWDSYVGATRNVVDAANAVGAKVVLVSTDWVFDGTQVDADEGTPPNPVNLYGVLKLASELVVTERARDGAVARVAGVNGVHWAGKAMPRHQDAGFGYFVTSVVDALSEGRRFTVWDDPGINMIATPTLASNAAELMWRIVEHDRRGIFHCCGGAAIGRLRLAEQTANVFGLDASLLDTGPPDLELMRPAAVPYDTSLAAEATAAALDAELLSVQEMLEELRRELETRSVALAC